MTRERNSEEERILREARERDRVLSNKRNEDDFVLVATEVQRPGA